MEHHNKISKLLKDLKFVTRIWIEINDLSSGQYSVNRNIRFKTTMLRSDLCGYSDAYIVVKGKKWIFQAKNTLDSGNAGEGKNLHSVGREYFLTNLVAFLDKVHT